jgi:hypothetical protein
VKPDIDIYETEPISLQACGRLGKPAAPDDRVFWVWKARDDSIRGPHINLVGLIGTGPVPRFCGVSGL